MTATQVKEGQTFLGASKVVRYVNLVKLPHTIFALPFALVGVTLASYVAPVTISKVLWVVIAFTSARFAAMGFNRIVDRDVDALNPRKSFRTNLTCQTCCRKELRSACPSLQWRRSRRITNRSNSAWLDALFCRHSNRDLR